MKELLKENYNLGDMIVRNSEFKTMPYSESYNIRNEKYSVIERQLDVNEKLQIVDSWTDGLGSYLLDLISKFLEVKDNDMIISKTKWGGYNKTSLKSWFRKNDSREVVHIYDNASYRIFKDSYKLSLVTPSTEFGYKRMYHNEDIVHQWFHELILKLFNEETEYFNTTDGIQVKINRIKEMGERLGFGAGYKNQRLCDIIWNGKREGYSEEELDEYIEVLDKITKTIEDSMKLIDEVGDKYGL